MKKWSLLGMALLFVLGAAGCASTHTQPANLDNMPGSDHMAKGPGLFDQHSPYASNDGLVIYSDNPNEPSLTGPKHAKKKAPANTTTASANQPSAGGASGNTSSTQPSNYQQYKEFEQYQQFKNMRKDSPEYRKYQQWLQWKHYQAWKAQQTKQQ